MNGLQAVRWALYERFLSLVFLVVGVAVAAGGVWFGAADVFTGLLDGDSSLDGARNLPLAAGALVAGLGIWQLGSTAASLKTIAEAAGSELDADVGSNELEAEIAAVIDDRLDAMQAELEQAAAGNAGGQRGSGAGGFADPDEQGGTSGDSETSGRPGRERATYSGQEKQTGTADDSPADSGAIEDTGSSSGTDPNAAFEDV